ncbi:copper chaperone CopZ [Sphingobacterium allocomposti]|uniref:Copper chaperone CopZ n=2 Tax=Sphingobacterium allocomposti TaxID=415956 RepID=A0A5S5DR43_9SPHI|nr:copper chaperone CopZ [Sphingobacterium composti Yoo et al. 2007 non Ten et al. 2007]
MKSVNKIFMAMALSLYSVVSFAQIKNAKTETVHIYGECGMCRARIAKAGNIKKVALVNWDENTKKAEITYDSEKTNTDEILKRIALAGHDNEKFLAPDDAYAKLHGCCQYQRTLKDYVSQEQQKSSVPDEHLGHHTAQSNSMESAQEIPQLKQVFDHYFALKDALVKTDGNMAKAKATDLSKAIKAVDVAKLNAEERAIWENYVKDFGASVDKIIAAKDISGQRKSFSELSKPVYELAKVSKQDSPVYYQHCPMFNGGANWLSKENTVKNPYYGSQMLTCGSVVETIK